MTRLVMLDTETTGLEAREGHRIIEIGCIEVLDRRITERRFHRYLNPERDSDPGALQVHGLSTDFLADKPRFAEVADDLLAFVADAEVVIHNADFDTGFLDEELRRSGRGGRFRDYCSTVTDSLTLAREQHPGKRNSLDALCERYQVSNAHRTLHGALLDAGLLAEVYLAMTRGQDSLVIDFAGDAVDEGAREVLDLTRLLVLAPSAAELAAHAAVLDRIEKDARGPAVWRRLHS